MKKYLLSFSILFCVLQGKAQSQIIQPRCGTEAPPEAWDKWFNARVTEFIASQAEGKLTAANYVIPVVFHVIHGGQNEGSFPNLSFNQLNSQIAVLNNDFAGTGLNVGNINSTGFSSALISNCNVTFCMAEKDPQGTHSVKRGCTG